MVQFNQTPGYIHRLSAHPASMAYVALELLSSSRPLVILTKTEHQALVLKSQLSFFKKEMEVVHFQDRGVMLYDELSPREESTARRLYALSSLKESSPKVILVSMAALLTRLPPKSLVLGRSLNLKVGMNLESIPFCESLLSAGYRRRDEVMEMGEFAVRGSLLELFPMGEKQPVRLELFDTELESIRPYQLKTGHTSANLQSLSLSVVHEFPTDSGAISQFISRFESHFGLELENSYLAPLKKGRIVPGLESFLPLFFEETATLFDYLPQDAVWMSETNEALMEHHQDVFTNAKRRFEARNHPKMPLLEPKSLLINLEEMFSKLKLFERLNLVDDDRSIKSLVHSPFNPNLAGVASLKDLVAQHYRIVVLCGSRGRAQLLEALLSAEGLKAHYLPNAKEDFLSSFPKGVITLLGAECLSGFYDKKNALLFLSEKDLSLQKKSQKHKNTRLPFLGEELNEGDYVVHREYGIGQYLGLVTFEDEGIAQEFLHIRYKDGAELYAALDELNRIHRYQSEEGEIVELTVMGSKDWKRGVLRAQKKLDDVAVKLLLAYAKRQSQKSIPCVFDEEAYRAFVDDFPYQETSDQLTVTETILSDMSDKKPMERLLCGDVGLGKTEVAMRAMFVAVHSGRQCALLVPTTLLCEQHYERLVERFSSFGVRIGMLSRFQNEKNNKETIQNLKEGLVDIVVGTHKLLSTKIQFKDLGLLVIDEEQRFGVKQKEKLREKFSHVDTLTMTATPIPRTLQMAMSEWQDLSLMMTPPKDRLPIQTFLIELESEKIDSAIEREVGRGGQVYYLYNQVQHINEFAKSLQERLGKSVSVGVIHGQLKDAEMEQAMLDFYQHRHDVLVCSTIIETGLDVPNANTIIIHRAERLGLAQLHQIRGRVGRSHHQAYCYLVCPEERLLKEDQKKRVNALVIHQELGSGFSLAMQDLDIRGAGEFLGEAQSGQMKFLGHGLYMKMLSETISKIKSGELKESIVEKIQEKSDIELGVSKILPQDYVHDPVERLMLYQRIMDAKDEEELSAIALSMIESYGALPKDTKTLLQWAELRLLCQEYKVDSVSLEGEGAEVCFSIESKIDTDTLMRLLKEEPTKYKLRSQHSIWFSFEKGEETPSRPSQTKKLIQKLCLNEFF